MTEVGLRLQDTTVAELVIQVRATSELKEFMEAIVMVDPVEFPGSTLPDVEEAVMLKSGVETLTVLE